MVEPNFNPEVGFLRRRDFRSTSGSLRFSPRPQRLEVVRKFSYEGELEYITNTEGVLESRAATGTFRTEFNRGDLIRVSAERTFEFLARPFRIMPDVTIPVGGYSFTRSTLSYQLPATFRVRGTVRAAFGSFYDGTRTEVQYSGRIDVSHRITVEPSVTINWADLPWGAFRTDLVSTRTAYTFSPRSALGALVQYNSSSHSLSTNIRLRWEYMAGSDLFLVYSEGRDTLVSDRFAELQARALVVKVTRLLRY